MGWSYVVNIRELTNRWLPRGRRRLNTRSSLCACATGCGIICRVVLKEATTSEERFWSRLHSNASKGTFCSEYLLNLTLNPQIPSKYANRSFPETAFYFIQCYSRHSSYLSNRPRCQHAKRMTQVLQTHGKGINKMRNWRFKVNSDAKRDKL